LAVVALALVAIWGLWNNFLLRQELESLKREYETLHRTSVSAVRAAPQLAVVPGGPVVAPSVDWPAEVQRADPLSKFVISPKPEQPEAPSLEKSLRALRERPENAGANPFGKP